MKFTLKDTIILAALIVMLAATALAIYQLEPKTAFGTTDIPQNTPMKQGGVLCGNASSTLLVATSTSGRSFMTISNDSAAAIFIGFGNSAAVDTGTMINASSTMTLDSTHSYTGAIYCAAKGTTASTTFSDSQG